MIAITVAFLVVTPLWLVLWWQRSAFLGAEQTVIIVWLLRHWLHAPAAPP